MTKLQSMAVMAAFSIATVGFATGSIGGKANFKGTAPKSDVIKMASDAACAKAWEGKKPMKDDVVVNNGGLKDVFVYVKEGAKAGNVGAVPTTPVKFDQQGCMYHPKVFGVRAGQEIEIFNDDATMHNVHALPKANPSFNNAQPAKAPSLKKKFAKPEMAIKIKCDVHGWMLSYANVMDHPFFAVTDANGAFKIEGLNPGTYTVEAWHEKLGTKTGTATVADNGTATVDFAFGGTATN